jgi:hypothetical protein
MVMANGDVDGGARSTTQRRGKTTKPFTSSFRLTIARRSRGTFATADSTCHAL